jgi:hypothetical protein
MDILSDDGTQLVENLKNWEEMFNRPRYEKNVDPHDVNMVRILSSYEMSEKNTCGLSICKQPHNKGFLVLCKRKSGSALPLETNIGSVCGANIFGVTFKEQQNSYNRDLNTIRYRTLIEDSICKVGFYRERIHKMRKIDGGDRAYALVRNLVDAHGIQFSLKTKLERRAKLGNNSVSAFHKASKRDIELEESMKGRKLTEAERADLTQEIPLGSIAGVRAIIDYKLVKSELVNELPKLLSDLEALKPEELHFTELTMWSKRLDGLDERFIKVTDYIEDCKRFSLESNIQFIKENIEWI